MNRIFASLVLVLALFINQVHGMDQHSLCQKTASNPQEAVAPNASTCMSPGSGSGSSSPGSLPKSNGSSSHQHAPLHSDQDSDLSPESGIKRARCDSPTDARTTEANPQLPHGWPPNERVPVDVWSHIIYCFFTEVAPLDKTYFPVSFKNFLTLQNVCHNWQNEVTREEYHLGFQLGCKTHKTTAWVIKLKKCRHLGSQISWFDFQNNDDINDEFLRGIGDAFPNLRRLNLSSCKNISANGFTALSSLKKLEEFKACKTNIDDNAVKAIVSNNKNLTTLDLSACQNITPQGFVEIAGQLKHLTVFIAKNTNIDDNAAQAIVSNNEAITTLDLSACLNITPQGFVEIAGQLKHLEFFKAGDSKINDDALKILAEQNRNLITLDLSYTEYYENLTSQAFVDIAPHLAHLKHLVIPSTKVDGTGLFALTSANKNLEFLDISCCLKIGANGIKEALGRPLSHLRTLDLSATNIKTAGLRAIVDANPQLEFLRIGDCEEITGPYGIAIAFEGSGLSELTALSIGLSTGGDTASLTAITRTCKKLHVLDIIGRCDQLSADALATAVAELPALELLIIGERKPEFSPNDLVRIITANPRMAIAFDGAPCFDNYVDYVKDTNRSLSLIQENKAELAKKNQSGLFWYKKEFPCEHNPLLTVRRCFLFTLPPRSVL